MLKVLHWRYRSSVLLFEKPPPVTPVSLQAKDMLGQEKAAIRLKFARLKQEPVDFDAAINVMIMQGCNLLQIQRMKKKKKLILKDKIAQTKDRILPDIIA